MLNQCSSVGTQRAVTLLAANSSARRNTMSDEMQTNSESSEFAEAVVPELVVAIAVAQPLTEADRQAPGIVSPERESWLVRFPDSDHRGIRHQRGCRVRQGSAAEAFSY